VIPPTIALARLAQGNLQTPQGQQGEGKMALTREFRETVYRRAQRDAAFRKALLTEAVNAYLDGDEDTGKTVLRDVINATVGFERLAADLGKPSKSLHRMLGPSGNPSTANFFAILQVVQKRIRTRLTVKAA
jgi:DNA-binding phage protein